MRRWRRGGSGDHKRQAEDPKRAPIKKRREKKTTDIASAPQEESNADITSVAVCWYLVGPDGGDAVDALSEVRVQGAPRHGLQTLQLPRRLSSPATFMKRNTARNETREPRHVSPGWATRWVQSARPGIVCTKASRRNTASLEASAARAATDCCNEKQARHAQSSTAIDGACTQREIWRKSSLRLQ